MLLALLLPARVVAQDRVQFLFGASATDDSNVFRLPDSVDPQSVGRPGRSDTSRSGYVSVRVDVPYSLQRFQLDATQTAHRYDKFTDLDYDASRFRGAWLWRLTPRVSGVLSADYNESAVPFSDFEGTELNIRTTENRVFNLESLLHGGWRALFGISSYSQESSLPVAAEADFKDDRADVGLKYLFVSGSLFGFIQRWVEGDYLNRVVVSGGFADNSYRERQSELTTYLVLTGRSIVQANIAWIDRHHPNLPERDYDAVAGNALFSWSPTAKLQLGLIARRDISAAFDPLATYTTRDTLAVAPTWQATRAITLRGRLARLHRDYRNADPSAPARRDDTDQVEVGLDWTPMRNLTLSASVRNEDRVSNQPRFDYRGTVSSLNASFVF